MPTFFTPNNRAVFTDNSGSSITDRISGSLQASNDNGVTFFPIGGGSSPSMINILQRGYSRLATAVTPAKTKAFAEEFLETGWIDSTGTNNFTVPSSVVGGGFLRSSGTSSKVFRGVATTRIPRLVALDESTPWWLAFGFRLNSPGAGNDWCLFGMSDPGSLITAAVGLYEPGPGGLSKFAAYTFNGAGEDDTVSTISVDGGIHTGEIWFNGSNFFMSIDQETPIQMTHTHLFTGTAVAPCWLYDFSVAGTADVFWRAGIWPVAYSV